MNLLIERFKKAFLDLVNSFELPIGVMYYILKYEMKLFENVYYGILNSELIEQLKKKLKDSIVSLDEAN